MDWPVLNREQELGALDSGMGASRYKDYNEAPFVQMVHAHMPHELWSGVFFSWLSMKGHLQGAHGVLRVEMYATRFAGRVYALFMVVWEEADAMMEWLYHGYPIEEMLRQVGVQPGDITVALARDFS